MGKQMLTKQGALRLAGDRRRELDRARGEQDKRVEVAAAEGLVALQVRADAQDALEAAQAAVGEAVRQMLSEDVSADRAAALLDIDVTEVRRLMKVAPADTDPPATSTTSGSGSVTALSDAGGSRDATRRAG